MKGGSHEHYILQHLSSCLLISSPPSSNCYILRYSVPPAVFNNVTYYSSACIEVTRWANIMYRMIYCNWIWYPFWPWNNSFFGQISILHTFLIVPLYNCCCFNLLISKYWNTTRRQNQGSIKDAGLTNIFRTNGMMSVIFINHDHNLWKDKQTNHNNSTYGERRYHVLVAQTLKLGTHERIIVSCNWNQCWFSMCLREPTIQRETQEEYCQIDLQGH